MLGHYPIDASPEGGGFILLLNQLYRWDATPALAGCTVGVFWRLDTRKLSKVELPTCMIVSIERATAMKLHAFQK